MQLIVGSPDGNIFDRVNLPPSNDCHGIRLPNRCVPSPGQNNAAVLIRVYFDMLLTHVMINTCN